MTILAGRARRSCRDIILPHGKAAVSCSRRRGSMSYAGSRRNRIINDALRRGIVMRRRRGRYYRAGLIPSLFLSSRRPSRIPWKTALEARRNRIHLSCEFCFYEYSGVGNTGVYAHRDEGHLALGIRRATHLRTMMQGIWVFSLRHQENYPNIGRAVRLEKALPVTHPDSCL